MTSKTTETPEAPPPTTSNKPDIKPHQDYVISVRVSHPASSWTVSATFHLMDPRLCTDPAAVNGPVLARLDSFINKMTEL